MILNTSTPPCPYGEAIRALSDNRDRYIEQSRNTEAGKLAELPPVSNWTSYAALKETP